MTRSNRPPFAVTSADILTLAKVSLNMLRRPRAVKRDPPKTKSPSGNTGGSAAGVLGCRSRPELIRHCAMPLPGSLRVSE
jgi:hypothetical protein